MSKKNRFVYFILAGIFLLGFFLRLYRLGVNLPPLYSDETSGQLWYWSQVHDNSISLIERLLRVIMTSPYSLSWLFGYSTFIARLPALINGSLLILVIYIFSFGVGKSSDPKRATVVALLSSLLLSLLPWSYTISRIYGNFSFLLVLICIHIYLLLISKSIKDVVISIIPLVISTYYYPSMVIIAPICALIPILEIWRKLLITQKKLFVLALIVLISSLGLFLNYRFKLFDGGARGLDLAIWRDVNTPYEIDKFRALSWNSPASIFSFGLPPEQLANKIVYNKVIANLSIFTRNYFSFFSPDWLFLKGDAILRHSTGQVGAFYPLLIPFMIYGAFVFFSQRSYDNTQANRSENQKLITRNKIIFLIWILASPIPAAITKDGAGYLLRVVTMLPFLTYFCALGVAESFNLIKKNWRITYGIIIGLIGIYSVYYFFFGYFHVYPSLSARSYEYGFKELSDFQEAHNNASMLIIWDGYYHSNDFRFWQKTPLDHYETFKLKEVVVGESHFNQTFSNLYFVNPKSLIDLKSFLKENSVDFVVLPDRYFVNYPSEIDKFFATPSATIKYPDQTPALRIFFTNQ